MTIARPKITGGPANDVGLAAFSAVIRYVYATGGPSPTIPAVPTTDEQAIELFAAFLAGAGSPAPPRRPSEPG